MYGLTAYGLTAYGLTNVANVSIPSQPDWLHAEARRVPSPITYNSERAIAVRGTAALLALAEKLIQDWDR
ncbi:MAG: hypothetical protein ABI823_07560 [Bryobacteraceae bacterium]